MPSVEPTQTPSAPADFTPKVKFAVAIGAQLFVGLLGVAVTAAVTVALAKSSVAIDMSSSD